MFSPVLFCDSPLGDGRLIVINWMVCVLQVYSKRLHDDVFQYGGEVVGVVYPGTVMVAVELDPGGIGCSGVTASDTSCTTTITRDDSYTVSLTLSNDVGSTEPEITTFDCKPANYSPGVIHLTMCLCFSSATASGAESDLIQCPCSNSQTEPPLSQSLLHSDHIIWSEGGRQ